MASMDIFSEAKQFFKAESWIAARQALLKIVQNAETNNNTINQKAFEKLGDISLKLNELNDCKMYYLKAINYCDINTNQCKQSCLYLKYAKLLHYELTPSNKLTQRYETAKKYYIKCLEFDNNKASVHYHIAILLFYNLLEKNKAFYHIQKCIRLKPKITKYHFEYALMLKHENNPTHYDKISLVFETALQLSSYQDTKILTQYATFLINCKNEKEKGTKFMKLASSFKQTQTPTIKHQNEGIQQEAVSDNDMHISSVMLNISNSRDNYRFLKWIIYNFDQTITSCNLYEYTNGDISSLYSMNDKDFLAIFSWRDRIRRLTKHFECILSKGVKIMLLFVNYSNDYIDIIHEALNKSYLRKFFDNEKIVKIDCKNEINDKLNYVKLFQINNGLTRNELLYIDNNRVVIERMRDHCFSIYIPEPTGLTLRDLENIEQNIGIKTANYSSFTCAMPESLMKTNGKIYFDMKMQVVRSSHHNTDINNLDVVQWIHNNWTTQQKQPFIEFCSKYKLLCCFGAKYDIWTVHEIVSLLLEIEPLDSDLNSKKAMCVSSMGKKKEAEKYYKKSTCGRNTTSLLNYGYFLMGQRRENEAIEIFQRALKISPISIKSNIGIGRTLGRLRDFENAEYYFKKAVVIDPTFDTSHYRYGTCLYEMGRYKEAGKELSMAVKLWPHSDMNHYMLALNYLCLNDINAFKYHLVECLKINPGNEHATYRYYKFFDAYYVSQTANKYILNGRKQRVFTRYVPTGTEKEFEIFWHDKAEFFLIDDAFQTYQQCFIEHKLNNIMSLFSMYSLKLKEIGIRNDGHSEIIMNAIDKYMIIENQQFKDWLGNIVFDEEILKYYCETLMNNDQPIYSFDSFYRNVSNQCKLRKILGTTHYTLVTNIWQIWESYCNQFSEH